MTKLGKPESECHRLLRGGWLLPHHFCYDILKTYDAAEGASAPASPSDMTSRLLKSRTKEADL